METSYDELSENELPEPLPENPTWSYRPGVTMPTEIWVDQDATLSQFGTSDDADDDQAPILEGGYQLGRLIGSGGMGEVWQALQVSLGRTVAVKRIREDRAPGSSGKNASSQADTEFRQEAYISAGLEHPNIVPVHDLGVDEFGRPLLATKLVRGEVWERQIYNDFSKLTVDEFLGKHLAILSDVAQAVALLIPAESYIETLNPPR